VLRTLLTSKNREQIEPILSDHWHSYLVDVAFAMRPEAATEPQKHLAWVGFVWRDVRHLSHKGLKKPSSVNEMDRFIQDNLRVVTAMCYGDRTAYDAVLSGQDQGLSALFVTDAQYLGIEEAHNAFSDRSLNDLAKRWRREGVEELVRWIEIDLTGDQEILRGIGADFSSDTYRGILRDFRVDPDAPTYVDTYVDAHQDHTFSPFGLSALVTEYADTQDRIQVYEWIYDLLGNKYVIGGVVLGIIVTYFWNAAFAVVWIGAAILLLGGVVLLWLWSTRHIARKQRTLNRFLDD
jgi:hypothetical protein